MSTSTTQLIRFLQQENARLKTEVETLHQENQALKGYLHSLQELQ